MARRKSPARKRATAKKSSARPRTTTLQADEPAPPEATFIFEGTVLALGSTTLAEVEAAHDTVVVQVDDIHKGPELTHGFVGEPVTVRLSEGQTVDLGQQYLFSTISWIFGSSLAVICLSLEPFHPDAVSALQSRLAAAPDETIRDRAARAELVVQGHVSQVREVKRERSHPITEHDPMWQDAVVEVHKVPRMAMGRTRTPPKEVVVRFAASRDVRWARAPKFRVGHKGLWLLGDTSATVAAARSAMSLGKNHYLCVEPEDFYPEEQAPAAAAALSSRRGRS